MLGNCIIMWGEPRKLVKRETVKRLSFSLVFFSLLDRILECYNLETTSRFMKKFVCGYT